MTSGGELQKTSTARKSVWDLPTRVTHWGLLVCVAAAWSCAELGWFEWHRRAGLAVLALVVFRIYWGFTGSSTARFAHFVRAPREVLSYTWTLHRRDYVRVVGHNPLGGWSALLLLFALCTQVCSGLFSVDVDGIESGPLSRYVTFGLGRKVAAVHATLFNGLCALIALHVAAIVYYKVRKRVDLIGPMITGRGQAGGAVLMPAWRSLLGMLLAIVTAWAVASWPLL